MRTSVRFPHILVCYTFIGQQRQCNDEWNLHDCHSNKEDETRLNNVPQKGNTCSKVNFRQLIYTKGRLVNNVEVESEQPAPDDVKCYVTTAAYRGGEKEFETYYRNYKGQRGYVLRVDEQLPAVKKYSPVEAGHRFTLFDFKFDFLCFFVVFRRDYKNLSAGCAPGTFSCVFAVKGNQGIAAGTVELDCHTLTR